MELVLKGEAYELFFFWGEGHVLVVFASRGMFVSSRPRGGSWDSSPVPPRTTGIVEEALFAAGC